MPLLVIPFPEIDPVLIEIGPIVIRWYALAYIAGLLMGWRYMIRLSRRPGAPIDEAGVDDLLFWITIGVVLGGRFGYVSFYNPAYYLANPVEALMVWRGGMSFHGGLLGVMVAGVWFARRRGLAVLSIGDLVASAVALVGTHGMHRVLQRRGWLRLGLRALALRMLGMCVLTASVVVTVAIGLERLAFPTEAHPSLAPSYLVRLVAYWTIVIAFWSVFYLLFHFFREARIAERDRWKLEAAVRQGELELLKSQLDPHFLFNSLNSIRSLILEHPGKARNMVTRLAGILRYSLRSGSAQTVTLDTELISVKPKNSWI